MLTKIGKHRMYKEAANPFDILKGFWGGIKTLGYGAKRAGDMGKLIASGTPIPGGNTLSNSAKLVAQDTANYARTNAPWLHRAGSWFRNGSRNTTPQATNVPAIVSSEPTLPVRTNAAAGNRAYSNTYDMHNVNGNWEYAGNAGPNSNFTSATYTPAYTPAYTNNFVVYPQQFAGTSTSFLDYAMPLAVGGVGGYALGNSGKNQTPVYYPMMTQYK